MALDSYLNSIHLNELPIDRFVCVKETSYLTGQAVSTVWRKVKLGAFPKPIRISAGMTRWRLSDIQKYMEDPQAWIENNAEGK